MAERRVTTAPVWAARVNQEDLELIPPAIEKHAGLACSHRRPFGQLRIAPAPSAAP